MPAAPDRGPGRVSAQGKGRIELRLGWQVVNLVGAGVPGMLPLVAWTMAIAGPLLERPSASGATSVWPGILGGVAAIALVVLPWLTPWLVLRARQPHGAHLEWDDVELVEWDGAWKRAVVTWRNGRAASVSWVVQGRTSSWPNQAVQIVDTVSGSTITAWEFEPRGAPVIRRRLCAKDLKPLLAVLEERGVPLSGHADWSLAAEPGRRRSGWALWLGRAGYPCAVLAPLLQAVPRAGLAVGLVAAILLSVRARPVCVELWTVLAQVRSRDQDAGHRAADRLKLRAIRFEALVRAAFVLCTLASLAGLAS